MTDAPERIIVKWTPRGNGQVLTPASAGRVTDCGANYVRESVLVAERAAHEAAVAAARAEGLRIGAEVAEAHFQRVHPHSPDDPKGDLVAQGYGNAAINIKLALLAAATAEASK